MGLRSTFVKHKYVFYLSIYLSKTIFLRKIYTKMSDVTNPFAMERIKKQDPAEYTNMINPDPYPRYASS